MRHTAPARPSNKDLRKLLSEAHSRGWAIAGGGERHYQLRCPNPCLCLQVLSSTGCFKAVDRALTRLRRHTCWNTPNPN